MTYAEHIDELLQEHGITADWRRRTRCRAWRKTRRVRLEPVQGASSYAIALHEIGHIVGPCYGRRLNKERQAWRWAETHAVEWTTGMARLAFRCLVSYEWCERIRLERKAHLRGRLP